jgi:hypothetical protein
VKPLSWSIVFFSAAIAVAAGSDGQEKSVSYSGAITPFLVDNFIDKIKLDGATKLIVNSQGGDVAAAIKLGRWVRSRNLDVEVRGQCNSACANYIFFAGNRKIIAPRSIVLWHGSIEQKDIREMQRKYAELLLKSHDDRSSLTEEEASYLESKRKAFQLAMEMRELQARFYDELEINEYITRLGQEPVHAEIDWATASPRVMARFGVRNVEAPDDYATCAYLLRAFFPVGLKVSLFDVDQEGRMSRTRCVSTNEAMPR